MRKVKRKKPERRKPRKRVKELRNIVEQHWANSITSSVFQKMICAQTKQPKEKDPTDNKNKKFDLQLAFTKVDPSMAPGEVKAYQHAPFTEPTSRVLGENTFAAFFDETQFVDPAVLHGRDVLDNLRGAMNKAKTYINKAHIDTMNAHSEDILVNETLNKPLSLSEQVRALEEEAKAAQKEVEIATASKLRLSEQIENYHVEHGKFLEEKKKQAAQAAEEIEAHKEIIQEQGVTIQFLLNEIDRLLRLDIDRRKEEYAVAKAKKAAEEKNTDPVPAPTPVQPEASGAGLNVVMDKFGTFMAAVIWILFGWLVTVGLLRSFGIHDHDVHKVKTVSPSSAPTSRIFLPIVEKQKVLLVPAQRNKTKVEKCVWPVFSPVEAMNDHVYTPRTLE